MNYKYYIPINDGNNNGAFYVHEIDTDKYLLATDLLRTSFGSYIGKGDTDVYVYEITPKKYNINKNISGEGSLTINSKAIQGEKVSYNYEPSEGYEFESIIAKDNDGNVIETNNNSFIMPEKNVNIKFKKKVFTITTDISISEKIDSDEVKVEYGTDHVITFAVKYGYI